MQIFGWFSAEAVRASQQKAVQRILIARELRRQKFQRNFAPQIEIFSLIDDTHPAAA